MTTDVLNSIELPGSKTGLSDSVSIMANADSTSPRKSSHGHHGKVQKPPYMKVDPDLMVPLTIIQVTNIAPQATIDQLSQFFSHIGPIDDIRLYPTSVRDTTAFPNAAVTPRICFIKFAPQGNECEAFLLSQFLANTVFLDRALNITPLPLTILPEESTGASIAAIQKTPLPNHAQGTSVVNGGTQTYNVNVSKNFAVRLEGIGAAAQITTQDTRLTLGGLPSFSTLAPLTSTEKFDRVHRTVCMGGFDRHVSIQQVVDWLQQKAGEVCCARFCTTTEAPYTTVKFVLVEFKNFGSVPNALMLNDSSFESRVIKVCHSKVAVFKPPPPGSKSLASIGGLITAADKIALDGGVGLRRRAGSSSSDGSSVSSRGDRRSSRRRRRHRSRSRRRHRSRSRSRRRHGKSSRSSRSRRSRSSSNRRRKSHRSRSPDRSMHRGDLAEDAASDRDVHDQNGDHDEETKVVDAKESRRSSRRRSVSGSRRSRSHSQSDRRKRDRKKKSRRRSRSSSRGKPDKSRGRRRRSRSGSNTATRCSASKTVELSGNSDASDNESRRGSAKRQSGRQIIDQADKSGSEADSSVAEKKVVRRHDDSDAESGSERTKDSPKRRKRSDSVESDRRRRKRRSRSTEPRRRHRSPDRRRKHSHRSPEDEVEGRKHRRRHSSSRSRDGSVVTSGSSKHRRNNRSHSRSPNAEKDRSARRSRHSPDAGVGVSGSGRRKRHLSSPVSPRRRSRRGEDVSKRRSRPCSPDSDASVASDERLRHNASKSGKATGGDDNMDISD